MLLYNESNVSLNVLSLRPSCILTVHVALWAAFMWCYSYTNE